MLITNQTLKQHLNDPQWVIFDCRHDLTNPAKGEAQYREGHIPGAHFANTDVDLSGEKTGLNGRHPLPPSASFIAFLARHGVTNQSTIVAYDDVGGQFAARLWWMCRWVGLTQVALLDGGISKWVADGLALSSTVPVVVRTAEAALNATANPLMLISAVELLAQLADDDLALIDARPPERYRGDIEPMDPVAGHIPGALNHFYKNNLAADLTFKSADILRKQFAELIGNRRLIVNQCGSGVTACANIFALELAGVTNTQLYAGSWSEWVSDPARPVVTLPIKET